MRLRCRNPAAAFPCFHHALTTPPLPPAPPEVGLPLSRVLLALAERSNGEGDRISVHDLLKALGDRAVGALLFIFAVPNVLPVPPGVSVVLGTPLVFLSAQLMLDMKPWLPALVTRRSLSAQDFGHLVQRVVPWLQKAETLLRPRLKRLATPPMEYVAGAVCLLLSLILVLPIPLGNALPALAICLLALGILEHDGVWIVLGYLTGVVAVVVVSGVVYALAQGALYALARFMGQ